MSSLLRRFARLIGWPLAARATLPARTPRQPEAIHQLSPNLGFGDAISNEMFELRSMLRGAGYRSEIVADFVDAGLASEGLRPGPGVIAPGDALIYHHSIGAEATQAAIDHPGPKGLVYHNITPAEFFRPFRPDFARVLREGREDLWRLARAFPVSVGDSRFNAEELRRFGFRDPGVLPLPIEPDVWDLAPTPAWMERLRDGRRNILFVGRVAPNKRQERLLQAFSILRGMTDARLVIAGAAPPGDPYSNHVRAWVGRLGLGDDVIVTGHCSRADLHAFFRCADLFWSFSEHEGFCVPLVEAMWFDVPILALASTAVPETLGDAGELFELTEDDATVAAKAHRILENAAERGRIVAGQRRRREAFRRAATVPHFARFLQRMLTRQIVQDGAVSAGATLGVAVDRPVDIEPGRFRKRYAIGEEFVLCAGRAGGSRECGLLFDHFTQPRNPHPLAVKLVTLGEAAMEIPSHPRIVALGVVHEGAKWDALAACDVLVAPSPDESLPMALLQAWSVGKPVLVNEENEALRGLVVRANGGLCFRSAEDFSAALENLRNSGAADALGRQGFEYIERHRRGEAIEAADLDRGKT